MHREPHPFWRFSLHVYRAPGVQPACLALQDGHGADVNLVLLCAFAGHDGRSLDRRRLRQAMARVGHWQSDVIAPVRAARRAIKRHPPPDAQAAQELRKRILGVELELEHVEQSMLADLLARWSAPTRRAAPREAIEANLLRYLALLGAGPADAAHVEAIVQAGCGAAPR
ncbi:MAG TPA: TIGR02444 family protein [Burkholderiaceae bacterium]|nr:TIGR02444 family protein [Burkholderiaceae bacterium]